MTAIHASKMAKVSRNTANLYYRFFREKIYDHTVRAPRFDGEVEMDQAFFGKGVRRQMNRSAVMANPAGYGDWRPRGKRRMPIRNRTKIMVFGICRRGGDVYTHIIKKADRDTLFPIIHLIVEPKTTIYTDKWQGFNGLKIDGYEHKTVNHEEGPVGRDGAHTGNIDAFWSGAKRHLDKFKGISRHTFALHLKECEFRWNHKKDLLKVMQSILKK